MFSAFIIMGGIGMIVPVMPSYLEVFGVGGQVLGFLIAGFAFAQFLLSPIAGELSDRYGRKIFIISGLNYVRFISIIIWTADAVWVLFIARFLSGAGAAFVLPPVMAYVADITTIEERGKGMGMIGAAMSLGFTIGLVLAVFLPYQYFVSFLFRWWCCISSCCSIGNQFTKSEKTRNTASG